MILQGDCLDVLKTLQDNSVDCMVTDPPYGINFLGKSWDNFSKGQERLKKPDVPIAERDAFLNANCDQLSYKCEGMIQFFTPIWKEALRVMKPGAFGFIACIPRQDCLSRMIVGLEDAGFNVNFSSMYWTYCTGFPKSMNMGKAIKKRLGEDSEEAKKMEGSYGGAQFKPAVEIIITVMKPCTAGSYINQALENGKGVTWLDDCRVPYADENDEDQIQNKKGLVNQIGIQDNNNNVGVIYKASSQGRFPANLLISDQAVGETHSKFYDLDKWAEKNLPFLIVSKPSKSEKNAGVEKNNHPTVKPIKLMSYLITLGSRPGDVILDPFSGSFTTYCSAIMLDRQCIGIEKEEEYIQIGQARVEYYQQLKAREPLKV